MPSLHIAPPAAHRPLYPGLTDCQICILESVKLDGPATDADLLARVNRELTAAGIRPSQLFTAHEFAAALDGLAAAGCVNVREECLYER